MRASRVWAFATYELKRATARKKVLALVVLTILISTIPYYLLKESNAPIFTPDQYGYLWILGILIPNGFFIPFTALLIAAGSMSEEYEQGTAEVLLSKPVSRDEFILGKYLGGAILLQIVIILNTILTLSSATFTYGTQLSLDVLPGTVAGQALASMLFYSVAFMSGELVRRSSLSYIVASSVYFASEIAGIYLRIIYQTTGNTLYQLINYYLPTSPVGSLPVLVSEKGLPAPALNLFRLLGISSIESSILFSILLIIAYTSISYLAARFYFVRVDVAKKIS